MPFFYLPTQKLKRFSVRSSHQIWTRFPITTSLKNTYPVLPHKKPSLTKSDKIM
ncbi:hypothetical protein CO704_04455 [Cedecea neteri]|uniref:Uncharacterized protein n=1 Tax=Cedecea neteri TaxID=158822 RepID=A0A291E5H8_9ENTR|nr:hypothetical protein CO704_04455 [Cedecea neteri]